MTRKKHELVVANHPSELAINTGPKWKDFSKFAKLAENLLEQYQEMQQAIADMEYDSRPVGKLEFWLDDDDKEQIADAQALWQTFNGEHLYDADGELLGEEIAARLASTIGSVKVTGSTPEAFNERIVDHVGDITGLTWPALESACRKMEKEHTFLSIAEAITIIERQDELWDKRKHAIFNLEPLAEEGTKRWHEHQQKLEFQKAKNAEWSARSCLDRLSAKVASAENQVLIWRSQIGDLQSKIGEIEEGLEVDRKEQENARRELDEASSKKYEIMTQMGAI